MVSEVNVEYLWILIFTIQIFLYYIGQRFSSYFQCQVSCFKFGNEKFCKFCEFQNSFDNTLDCYRFLWSLVFTMSCVCISIYYFFIFLTFFSTLLPISMIYIFYIGKYDPLLQFCLPPHIRELYIGRKWY